MRRSFHGWWAPPGVVWAALPLALAACADRFCTAMGCESHASVLIEGFAVTPSSPLRVHACLDFSCVDSDIRNEPQRVDLTLPDTARWTAIASVRISQDGTVLLDTGARVNVTAWAVNGEGCGPVCRIVGLTFTPAGLRQDPPPVGP